MRKQLLPIFVILSLCLLLIPNVNAEELYAGNPKAWCSRTTYNQAALVHYYGNLQSVYNNVSIQTAYSQWAVNCGGYSYVTNTVTQNPEYAYGRIYYLVPTTNYWQLYTGSNAYWCLGFTLLYDSNGDEINSQTASTTTSLIRSANVFIQPESYNVFSTLTEAQQNCVVTHEIGHALGFGHTAVSDPAGNSIMDDGAISYTAITTVDQSNLAAKYPRP